MSKKRTIIISVVFSLAMVAGCFHSVAAEQEIHIVPKPEQMIPGDGTFVLSEDTVILAVGDSMEVAGDLSALLGSATGYEIDVMEPVAVDDEPVDSGILIEVDPGIEGHGEEGYLLLVGSESIIITASTPAGAFYAVQTLRQLLPPEIENKERVEGVEWKIPGVTIIDKPRFPWRGLMLDVARHFQSKEFVMKYIDTMALFKLNRLHLHLTDDQGWRLEIKKFPKLTEIGAWRRKSSSKDDIFGTGTGEAHGGFYTQEDMREIVEHAAKRHVTIVPEIEMPGHAQSALASIPGLSCTKERLRVRTRWGVNPEIYCAGSDKVFKFLEYVIDEVVELFPGEYIHIGGDEAPKDRWRACEKCQARIKAEGLKDEHELQSWFITKMEKYINTKGKKIIGWDEILEGGLAPNAAVMSWRGIKGGIESASQKHDVVMSPNSHCYLDYYQSKNEDGEEPKAIGGFLPMCKVYSFEPVPEELVADERNYILGTQGNVWTEYIKEPGHLEYMTYPRAAAVAEVGWTQPDLKDWSNFSSRIQTVLPRLDYLGVNYRKIHPGEENLCEQE